VLGIALGLAVLLAGPTSASPPSVTGSLQQGARLTATAGTWSGHGTITYAYQWYRCDATGAHCSSVRGATKATYTQASSDVGHAIGLTVRATDSTGMTPAYSSLAGLVAGKTAKVTATAQPTLAGTPTVGQALTVAPGTWSGSPGTFTYAWLRCNANGRLCAAITGATAAGYTPTAGDSGHTIIATVTATAGTAKQAVLTVASPVVA